MNGFINILKPSGMTSAAAVAKVRGKLKCHCGHMGTLDPMAEGVLPVAIGKTCRLFDFLLEKEKIYTARFKFGYLTDTLDKTGEVTMQGGRIPTLSEIQAVLPNFIGDIMQVPPKYSAKCVNGKRGYQLARKGVEFDLPAKMVNILNLTIISYENGVLELQIRCKGGTYVRSIGRDIATALNTVCTMEALRRDASGIFTMENGVWANDLAGLVEVEKYIIPSDAPLTLPKVTLNAEHTFRIKNGLKRITKLKEGFYSLYSPTTFIGVGESKDGLLGIKAYIMEE